MPDKAILEVKYKGIQPWRNFQNYDWSYSLYPLSSKKGKLEGGGQKKKARDTENS
jgi:hypothetical protein